MIGMIEITREDVARIVSAVGTMAIALCDEAESAEDLKEATELAVLHDKLAKMYAAIKKSDANGK